MVDCSASGKTSDHCCPGLFAGVEADLKLRGLETSQNYRVRVVPETNSTRRGAFSDCSWNSLLHTHVSVWIVPVLHIDQSPSLHQDPFSEGLAASIALTKSSGSTPRPCAPVP